MSIEQVSVIDVAARPTAVVRASTTWAEYPALWPTLSGEVWDCLRGGGITSGCPNVLLYLDDTPRVEVGVLLNQSCPLTGRVVSSALPSGRAATTVHHGPFAEVGEAHEAVLRWGREQSVALTRTRWEVYGPHRDDPAELWTEVYWLLASTRSGS